MKKKVLLPVMLAAGTILAAAARVYGISKTDMTMGSLVHGSEFVCGLLYFGVLLAAVVFGVIEGAKSRQKCAYPPTGAAGTIFVGIALMAVALCAAYDGLTEMNAFSPSGFLIFVDFIFAAVLAVIALVTLYEKKFKPGLGFVYSFGGIFCVARGICFFAERMVVTAIPEYLINCLSTIGGGVFFLVTAQLLSDNEGKFTKPLFYGIGTGTAALVGSAYLGTFAAKTFLPESISSKIVFSEIEAEYTYQWLHGVDAYQLAFPPVTDLGIAVFAAVTMIVVYISERAKEETKEE